MSLLPNIPLSILDTAPVERGMSPATSLAGTVELARRADRLRFTRFWVTEHHNAPSIASSSPAVLLGAIGSVTDRIRIGSGGVMLPNHPPLVVAEAFATLAALFPDRVDLGIGRAPGTDDVTARALRRIPAERFSQELAELFHFVNDSFPGDHPYHGVHATPPVATPPSVWLLGSSGNSAMTAAELGLPYAFAHNFFHSKGVAEAMRAYRAQFRPGVLCRPHAMIVVHVVCGENDEHARWLADPAVYAALRIGGGLRTEPMSTPHEVAAHSWTREQRADADAMLAHQAVGGPDTVRARLLELLEQTGADELMITNNVTELREKCRSVDRVREMFGERSPLTAVG